MSDALLHRLLPAPYQRVLRAATITGGARHHRAQNESAAAAPRGHVLRLLRRPQAIHRVSIFQGRAANRQIPL